MRDPAPLEEAWTLPASDYTDPALFRRELERVLLPAWQCVSHTGALDRPGAFVTAELCGEPIVVVRGEDDVIRAFSNVCRHRAGAVAVGAGCAASLRCHYHGWTYGLDGALCGAPEMQEAKNLAHADFGLRPLACTTWEGIVLVALDARAPPLHDALGPSAALARDHGVAELRFALRRSWDIRCNWKVYVDNFLEAYHVPRAHPGLHKVIDYKGYTVEAAGSVVLQRAGPNPALAPKTARRRSSTPRARSRVTEGDSIYLWLWPTFMLNVNPDYVQSNAILPLDVGTTRVVFDFFFPRGASKQTIARAVAFSEEIQLEDIALCESVQRNLQSRWYTAGRYCPRRENGLFHFHELLRAALA